MAWPKSCYRGEERTRILTALEQCKWRIVLFLLFHEEKMEAAEARWHSILHTLARQAASPRCIIAVVPGSFGSVCFPACLL